MKLLFAIGNPEPEYSFTRHNVGKDVVNDLVELFDLDKWTMEKSLNCQLTKKNGEYIFAKSNLHMNESGKPLQKIMDYYKISAENIVVLYDELDLVLGEYKFAYDKGSRIHNGIRSINSVLKDLSYWHLRIGVRGPEIEGSVQKTGINPSNYVLSKLNISDRKKISQLTQEVIKPILNEFLSKKE